MSSRISYRRLVVVVVVDCCGDESEITAEPLLLDNDLTDNNNVEIDAASRLRVRLLLVAVAVQSPTRLLRPLCSACWWTSSWLLSATCSNLFVRLLVVEEGERERLKLVL